MSIFKSKPLLWLARYNFVQSILEKTLDAVLYLMGIGAGAGVNSSGEYAIFSLLRDKESAPFCIFDLGANKGQFLGLALEKLNVDVGSVHSFEPSSKSYSRLVEKYQNESLVKLNNLAISDECETTTLYFDKPGSTLASLSKRNLKHINRSFEQSELVRTTTLDRYCEDIGILYIDLLKIDIEGHELDALKGARRMFSEKRVKLVSFEFGGCNIDSRTFFKDFWLFFEKYSFEILRITPSGYLHPVKAYSEICEQYKTTNYIASLKR